MSRSRVMPRILLFGPLRASVGGVATHLNQFFASSLAQQYELIQFQVGSEGRNEAAITKLIRLVTSPFALVFRILRVWPDIVHINSSLQAKAYWRDLTYMLLAKMLGRRVVFQVHGGELPSLFFGQNAFSQAFLRWSLNVPDAIVLLAEIEREAYRLFKTGKTIVVIPNAIDLDAFSGGGAKNFNGPHVVLGYIGRLADNKGVMETIKALAILVERGLDELRFYIAGSGPFEDQLRSRVRELGLESSVEFVGPVFGDEKIEFWRKIEIFVFPTFHTEGLPYTVLEALASGTPTISTKVGGIPEVIKDGGQGVLMDGHDPETIASVIEALVGDPEKLQRMSLASLARAREYYGVDRLAKQFDELYRELLTR